MLRVGGVSTWFIHVCSGSPIWNFHFKYYDTNRVAREGGVDNFTVLIEDS
jgi:hypothetical protein